jgi:hypothetical protein
MRWHGLDCGCERGMNFRVNRPMPNLGARGVLTKEVVAFPVLRWSDWSWNKSTAAVRAYIFQDVCDTRRAKCALVRADACFKRIGRQRLVAILASRSEFKHAAPVFSRRRLTKKGNRRSAADTKCRPRRGRIDRRVRPMRDLKSKHIVHRRGAIVSAASFVDTTGKTSNSTMSLQFAIH